VRSTPLHEPLVSWQRRSSRAWSCYRKTDGKKTQQHQRTGAVEPI